MREHQGKANYEKTAGSTARLTAGRTGRSTLKNLKFGEEKISEHTPDCVCTVEQATSETHVLHNIHKVEFHEVTESAQLSNDSVS